MHGRHSVVDYLFQELSQGEIDLNDEYTNGRNADGQTGFHFASINGSVLLMKFLLTVFNREQIDINAKDKNGNACFIKFLLQEWNQNEIEFNTTGKSK